MAGTLLAAVMAAYLALLLVSGEAAPHLPNSP
jgi:hypothetical protein